MSFERIGIRPAQILLPAAGVKPETWACIACDQYTSEPEYWRKAFACAGDAPSALRLILPEVYLKQSESMISGIHDAMARYLRECGVPEAQLLLEPRAANTWQNVSFSLEVVREAASTPVPTIPGLAVAPPIIAANAPNTWAFFT